MENKHTTESIQNINTLLLATIGENDDDSFCLSENIRITRGEVKLCIENDNSYYAADIINILLHSLNNQVIKVYHCIPVEQVQNFFECCKDQSQNYAFFPLNVAYDIKCPNHKNHWAALIVDKKNELVFYLDPAQKPVPKEIKIFKKQLSYT